MTNGVGGTDDPWTLAPGDHALVMSKRRTNRLGFAILLTFFRERGRFPRDEAEKVMRHLSKIEVLVLDDWGLATLTDQHRRDLLEILDDRYNLRATLITSQLPVPHWHEAVGDPTLADAILDRVVHNAYKINLTGNSMRKQRGKLTAENPAT